MNITSEHVGQSCQYAPVYLIQDPGAIQANTYMIAPSNVNQHNPVTNNLKTFYETSGSDLLNINNTAKPSILKKRHVQGVKSWKLSSFVVPKSDNDNRHIIYNNVVLKPTSTNTACTVNLPPKIMPKSPASLNSSSKYTSVQLIKLGETYHSLNKLSNEQMKMVNQALRVFNDPNKNTPEPTYDPETNTQYVYKLVTPKDIAVVGKRKLVTKKFPTKVKHIIDPEVVAEATITRSGRKVKLPKQILPEGSLHKSKKKSETIVTCFQCSADFGSLYRLQKHFENHPTHIPAKIHSNLFHCLLAIIKSGSEGDKTNIFIQQLEQLVVKLKSLLPCFLKKVDGTDGQSCTINDDVGRLFGLNPGKYHIDVDALNCVKDKNGYCVHNPQKLKPLNKHRKSKQSRNLSNEVINPENESENCARINSVAKWPTVSKRIWKLKQQKQESCAKKVKLQPDGFNESTVINVSELDDVATSHDSTTSSIVPQNEVIDDEQTNEQCKTALPPVNTEHNIEEHSKHPKNNHIKFHSAHFDIRSSPIKSSSTVFRKFQIDASKLVNCEAQVIRSLGMEDKEQEKDVSLAPQSTPLSSTQNIDDSMHDLFKDNVDLTCKESNVMDHELKEWIMSTNEKSQDSFTKSLIEPALIHIKDKDSNISLQKNTSENNVATPDEHCLSNQNESVLNFLEELGKDLTYPETEIRNSGVDFQLDLFTFNT